MMILDSGLLFGPPCRYAPFVKYFHFDVVKLTKHRCNIFLTRLIYMKHLQPFLSPLPQSLL